MQSVIAIFLSLLAGIAGYAGVNHLLVGVSRRPRDPIHLSFGLTCICVAVHILVVLGLHTATSVASYTAFYKYAFGPSSVMSILSLLWFVAFYTDQRPARVLLALSVWYLVILGLHLSLPFGILYNDIRGLRQITLPWGEKIVVASGTPSSFQFINLLFYLCLFIFFGYAIVRQYRHISRRRAMMLGLALLPFLVARVVDPLIVAGVINAPLTTQFAFFSIVAVMSLVLWHRVTQTEIVLKGYQLNLSALVATRTADLTHANERLTALKQVADISIRMNDLTVALHGISGIATSLFDARVIMLFIPSHQKTDRHTVVGFERGVGTLGPMPLDTDLADMPLTSQVLTHGRSLLLSALQTHPLPPVIRTFVDVRQVQSMMLIPLAVPGTIIGVLFVGIDQIERTFTSDEVSLAETIAGDISAAIENTRLYQRAVAARERLTSLYQASQAISQASLDAEQIYAELHAAVDRLMPTEAFVITLIDEASGEAVDVYLADKERRWPGKRYPLSNSFASYMLHHNASVRIGDFSTFPQSEFVFEMFGNEPDTKSGVAVLLRGSQQVEGVLFVQSYVKDAYSDADQESLELLAAHAVVALENSLRYHQAQDLAASAERSRLARDLHDAVTQTLYSAGLLAEALPTIWQRNSAAGERDLLILRQLVRGALAEMRTLLFELRPAALVAADLSTLLHQLSDTLTGNSHIPVELRIDGETPLPTDTKIVVYRIAQEAFNNIAKHAAATQVRVTMRTLPDQFFLSVRDDGRGFDPDTVGGDHLGTRIMAERAAAIGARLHIDSAFRQGTEVSLRWPASDG